jgi:hypothetical protein
VRGHGSKRRERDRRSDIADFISFQRSVLRTALSLLDFTQSSVLSTAFSFDTRATLCYIRRRFHKIDRVNLESW